MGKQREIFVLYRIPWHAGILYVTVFERAVVFFGVFDRVIPSWVHLAAHSAGRMAFLIESDVIRENLKYVHKMIMNQVEGEVNPYPSRLRG